MLVGLVVAVSVSHLLPLSLPPSTKSVLYTCICNYIAGQSSKYYLHETLFHRNSILVCFKFCLSSKQDPLQAATKFFGAPVCSIWMQKQQQQEQQEQEQQEQEQQQQYHEHCCILEAILKDAASQSKSLSLVSYSPWPNNRASPGSTASCACQERKNRRFLDFDDGLDFCCGG